MPWFRVDDTLHSHPKIRRAGLAAMGLWTIAGSYSCQYLTEGFVPDWVVNSHKSGSRLAHILISSGLWERSERDGETGYLFHDWDHFQMSKEEIEADREHNRERQRRFREKKREARNGVTNGVTNGGSNGTPTLPIPTQPNPTYVTTSSTQVSSSSHVSSDEGQHDVRLEPRSRPVSVSARKLAHAYTDIVKLADIGKVCGIITNAQAADYPDEQITAALQRLATNKMPVTQDTLRIEIESGGKPRLANGMTQDDNGVIRLANGQPVGGKNWEAY